MPSESLSLSLSLKAETLSAHLLFPALILFAEVPEKFRACIQMSAVLRRRRERNLQSSLHDSQSEDSNLRSVFRRECRWKRFDCSFGSRSFAVFRPDSEWSVWLPAIASKVVSSVASTVAETTGCRTILIFSSRLGDFNLFKSKRSKWNIAGNLISRSLSIRISRSPESAFNGWTSKFAFVGSFRSFLSLDLWKWFILVHRFGRVQEIIS